jgi:hypothetical protein
MKKKPKLLSCKKENSRLHGHELNMHLLLERRTNIYKKLRQIRSNHVPQRRCGRLYVDTDTEDHNSALYLPSKFFYKTSFLNIGLVCVINENAMVWKIYFMTLFYCKSFYRFYFLVLQLEAELSVTLPQSLHNFDIVVRS